MKYYLIIIGVFSGILCYGQTNITLLKPQNLVHVKKDSAIFRSIDGDFFVKGEKITIDSKVLSIQIDTIYNNLILFSKFKNSDGYKEVIGYSLNSDSVLWRYRTLCQGARLIKDYIALIYAESTSNNNKIFLLDRKTGLPKSNISNGSIFSLPDLDLLFYIYGSKLEIFDEKTGAFSNKIRIPSDYYFSSYAKNDSCLYLNINGIYAFDRTYKKIWEFGLSTMQLDLKSVMLSAGFGIGMGMLTGFAPIYYAPNFSADLNSDFYFYKGNVVISDRESIYSFNKKTGEVIWRHKLPYKTGYSHIEPINDSIASLINTGVCRKNGRIHSYGIPYYAWFNNNNGIVKTTEVFNTSESIVDFVTNKDTTLLLLNNGICKFKGQNKIADKIFTMKDSVGIFQLFYPDSLNLFYVLDSIRSKWNEPYSLKKSENDLLLISTKGLIILEENFNIIKKIPINSIGRKLYENNNFQLFETYIQNNNNDVFYNDLVKYDKSSSTSYRFHFTCPYILDNGALILFRQDSVEVFDFKGK